jgi:hypothetical protein
MLSRLLRRSHMYLALFLMPWTLMYTISTVAMNHRDHLRGDAGEGPPRFEKQFARSYAATFPEDATPQQKALQILRDFDLEGAHSIARPAPDGTITINRMDPLEPKRVVYRPAEGAVTVEKLAFSGPAFLERMHRRRGFQHPYAADAAWAVSVDLFIAAMIFWVVSGLWMWWELRATRVLGALFALGGAALFAAFLAVL